MSDGWKCDKCGKFFTPDNPGNHTLVKVIPRLDKLDKPIVIDLCGDCKKRFDRWIESTPYVGIDWASFIIDEWPVYISKDKPPYGWPVFEDGTPVKQGDEVLGYYDKGLVANRFHYDANGWTVASGHGYAAHSIRGIFVRPTKNQMAEYYKKWPEERKQQPNRVIYDGVGWTEIAYVADGGLNLVDDVNHPKHYDNGTVECIDWIEERLSPEEFKGYLLGNALKYSFRYEDKGKPVEDLRKAQWYLKKLEELA